MLIVAIPQPDIFVVVGEVVGAMAVLLVEHPFSVIFLPVGKRIDTMSLTVPLHVLTLVGVSVLVHYRAFAIGLAAAHLSFIRSFYAHLRNGAGAQCNLLGSHRERQGEDSQGEKIFSYCLHVGLSLLVSLPFTETAKVHTFP